MSHTNFQIMIEAMIKSFRQSTGKRIEETLNRAFCHYLYSIVNIYFKVEYLAK